MGRGGEQGFEQVERVALDTIRPADEEGLAKLALFHRQKYSDPLFPFTPAFSELLGDEDARPFLADPGSIEHRRMAEELVGRAVGFFDPAERQRRNSQVAPEDLIRPWLLASGAVPQRTPHIVVALDRVFHLRRRPSEPDTLCGLAADDEGYWRLAAVRGGWQANPSDQCKECEARLRQLKPDSPVALAAAEPVRFPVMSDQEQQEMHARLYALASEQLCWLAAEADTGNEVSGLLIEMINEGLNLPAAEQARLLAASRFLATPAELRLQRLFDTELHPIKVEGATRRQIEVLEACLRRAYGDEQEQLDTLAWPSDPVELKQKVFDRCNELHPIYELQREILTRLIGAYWPVAIGWVGATHYELLSPCIEIWQEYPQARERLIVNR